ncbi:MAG: DUF429 domain-containing protein [bacterium]|nr:DUF429 domain-containing protein [bacterium]
MKTHGVPLAKMFVEGAPRIERSPCSVLPCRPNGCDSLVLEAYPGRVARWAIGRRPYKTETKSKDTSAMRDARRDLIAAVLSGRLPKQYGVSVDLDDEVREELGDDFKGDRLDALLCAIQAAWAVSNKSFGIPQNAHIEEGWIVDPHCVET